MTPRQRDLLALRHMEIGDPAEMREQVDIVFKLGAEWFERRDAE
jgi:hypothetical protein